MRKKILTLVLISTSLGVNAQTEYPIKQSAQKVNNSPWYGLGESNVVLPDVSYNAMQLAGYYGLLLKTSSGELVLQNNGNVGIGTTSPNAQLHIVDTGNSGVTTLQLNNRIKFRGDGVIDWGASADYGILSWNTGKALIGGKTGKDLSLLAGGGERMIIKTDGNVGIGTSSPSGSISSNQTGLHILNDNVSYLSLESTAGSGKKYTMYSSTAGSFVFWDASSSTARGIIDVDGNWGIGTSTPKSKLAVNGQIRAKEVKVLANVNGVPDYVFQPDYDLRTLKETKKYITENKHLPEIPSAAEIGKNGIDLGDMNMRLLKKIEELTLYQIDLLERLEKLEIENARIDALEKKIELLNKN